MTQPRKPALARLANAANIILIGAGVLCLLIFGYFFYYYSWTGERQFSNWLGGLVYYAVPAVSAISFLASTKLKPSLRIGLVLLMGSFTVCLYAVEILVTLWFNIPSVIQDLNRRHRGDLARASGIPFDTRSKHQVIEDLRKQGVNAVPSFPGPQWEVQNDGTVKAVVKLNGVDILPLGNMANRRIVVCNEGGQFLTYDSDKHGFHNPSRLWDGRPIDIVAAGDSFVQGWCVASNKNFVALIREHFGATLNLGAEGYGPLDELAVIREYAQVLRPKIVLWFYYEGNDLGDLNSEKKSDLLMRYLDAEFSQGLFHRRAEIDRVLEGYVNKKFDENHGGLMGVSWKELATAARDLFQAPSSKRKVLVLSEVRQRLGLIQGIGGSIPQPEISARGDERAAKMLELTALLGKVLAAAKKNVEAWGGDLHFVFLPSWDRYVPGRSANPDRERVLKVASEAGLPIIDMHPIFLAQKDPLALFPFRLSGHYNDFGNQLIADAVVKALADKRPKKTL